jgi:hypothetical protein
MPTPVTSSSTVTDPPLSQSPMQIAEAALAYGRRPRRTSMDRIDILMSDLSVANA